MSIRRAQISTKANPTMIRTPDLMDSKSYWDFLVQRYFCDEIFMKTRSVVFT